MSAAAFALGTQVRAGFRLATSYRLNFALAVVGRFWWLAWVYFLAKLVPASRLPPSDMAQGYFAFALVGVAFQQYLGYLLIVCSEKLREDQIAGLVVPLLATPASPVVALFGPTLWHVVDRGATIAIMLVVGVAAFGLDLSRANWAAASIVLVLATVSVAAWSLLSASFTLVFKRGDPVTLVAGVVGYVFSGAYFPLDLLPPWMRAFAAVYPHAYAVTAARGALLGGASVGELRGPLIALAGFVLLLAPASWYAFHRAVRHVRGRGTAGKY